MCTQDAWEFPKQAPEVFYQKGGLEKLERETPVQVFSCEFC